MRKTMNGDRRDEAGSALIYILIAIALLAALTISFMEPSSQQTTSQNTFRTVSELASQADFVRSAVQECVLTHQGGDIGAINAGAQKNQPYPLMPDDTYLDTCTGQGAADNHNVSNLRCPGNPGDNPCHAQMFGGNTGKFLPPPPALFGPWQYYAGDDGVFFWIETTKTDPFLDTVLSKLDASFAECEADVVDTSAGTPGDKKLDQAGTVLCPEGSKCFRVWVLGKHTSYDGDKDGDEAACP
jgi:hypothetical protein